MSLGIWQIAIIVLLVLLVFGAGKLPRVMEDMAKGIKSFKKGLQDEDEPKNDAEKKRITDERGDHNVEQANKNTTTEK